MTTALKVVVAVLAFLAALNLVSALVLVFAPAHPSWPAAMLLLALRVGVAMIVARFIWRRLDGPRVEPGMWPSIIAGALLVGAVGFAVGFFGPILFTPEANQGPLLGIFITGPLGLICGGIAGAMRYRSRQK